MDVKMQEGLSKNILVISGREELLDIFTYYF